MFPRGSRHCWETYILFCIAARKMADPRSLAHQGHLLHSRDSDLKHAMESTPCNRKVSPIVIALRDHSKFMSIGFQEFYIHLAFLDLLYKTETLEMNAQIFKIVRPTPRHPTGLPMTKELIPPPCHGESCTHRN